MPKSRLPLLMMLVAAAPPWQRHEVAQTGVSVELPGEVEIRHSERPVFIGRLGMDSVVVELDGGWAAITVATAPASALDLLGRRRASKLAVEHTLKLLDAKVLTAGEVERGGLLGTTTHFVATSSDDQPLRGVSEVFTWDRHLATLTVVMPESVPETFDARFLGSLRVTPTP